MSEQKFTIEKCLPSKLDMVKCHKCGWSGKTEEAKEDTDSDGWENPSFIVHYCPNCDNEDQLDDYFYSDDIFFEVYKKRIAELEAENLKLWKEMEWIKKGENRP